MKIYSDDGKRVFSTVEECLKYEDELKQAKAKEVEEKKKYEREKAEAYKKVLTAIEAASNELSQYNKKYGSFAYNGRSPEMISSILDLFRW